MDPETSRWMLLVDYDPLEIANDHTLNLLLEQLSEGVVRPERAGSNTGEWVFHLLLEALKIFIEILL